MSVVDHTLDRRAFVRRTAAASATAWVAPSIISTTPVAAAVGSCVSGVSLCDFSTGLDGWVIDNNFGPGRPGLWTHNAEASRGSGSLHYGRGTSGNYRTRNRRNSGAITSPSFDMPASGSNTVRFSVFREVETWPTSVFDVLRLSILGTATNQVLWSAGSDGGTGGVFVTITVNLPATFDGDTVQFRFDFDTVDGLYNNFEGIYIDWFEVTACPTVPAGLSALSLQSTRATTFTPTEFPLENPAPRR